MPLPLSRRRILAGLAATLATGAAGAARAADLLPKHITPETVSAVKKGLDYLAKVQAADGSWHGLADGDTYPCAMAGLAGMAFLSNGSTSTRGAYADQVRRTTSYIVGRSQASGLIAEGEEQGHPMYGHGFGMMFLASAYGMETRPEVRKKMETVIKKAIQLTSTGQSNLGGWTYYPGGGDEGSVTVTQMQGLRAAHNAGFTIPKGTIENAIRYLELCKTPAGGICYSYGSGSDTRLPITAAAICCLYSAGEYESPLADSCMKFVMEQFKSSSNEFNSGHYFYLHLYASLAFYQAGDEYWDAYFPKARENLLKQQQPGGNWNGDGVGTVFGSALACILLQIPYKYLPIYQR
jgi:prenyltransferase beta subunit